MLVQLCSLVDYGGSLSGLIRGSLPRRSSDPVHEYRPTSSVPESLERRPPGFGGRLAGCRRRRRQRSLGSTSPRLWSTTRARASSCFLRSSSSSLTVKLSNQNLLCCLLIPNWAFPERESKSCLILSTGSAKESITKRLEVGNPTGGIPN